MPCHHFVVHRFYNMRHLSLKLLRFRMRRFYSSVIVFFSWRFDMLYFSCVEVTLLTYGHYSISRLSRSNLQSLTFNFKIMAYNIYVVSIYLKSSTQLVRLKFHRRIWRIRPNVQFCIAGTNYISAVIIFLRLMHAMGARRVASTYTG